MRLATILLMIGVLQVSAIDTYSQKTRISIDFQNTELVKVLDKIEEESEFFFLYNEKLLDTERKVNISAKNQLLDVILNDLFAGSDVNYIIVDRKIILAPDYLTAPVAQQTKITGKITTITGEPLPGVIIIVKGTFNGTSSDVNGVFTLDNVKSSDILTLSFVGMKKQEIPVGTTTNFEIVMEEEIFGVDEIVVTALGIEREEKALGYAIQKVSGDIVTTVKGVDVGTSLTGKVAGMLVKNSTEFTAEPEILIRGESPLLVVDGIPYNNVSLSEIPSDDIENISVLKGSTASALYGYRGASGAIMITTKKGSSKSGLSVTINSSTMFTAGFLAIPEMQSKYGRVINTSTNIYARSGDGSWGAPMEGQDVIQWDPESKSLQTMSYLPRGKNNFKNFLEQGYILNNNINLVQQGEFGSFRASVTSVRNKGQYPNSMFNKLTYSMGGDMKFKKFTLSSGMAYNKQTSPNIGFSGYTGYDPMYNLLVWAAADYDIRDYTDYWLVPNETQNNSYTSTNNNPYFDRYERIHSINKDVLNVNVDLNYEIAPWLKATIRSGYDFYSDRQEVRISKGSFQGGGSSTVIPNGTQIWGESAKGSYNFGLSKGLSSNNDILLAANTKYKKFTIDGLAGGTIFYYQDDGIEAKTQGGLSIPGFYSLEASVNDAVVNSSVYKRQVNSLFGRLAFSWNSLIYAEGTIRNDWSSTLSESTRSYLYPSLSGSFIASKLLPEANWLSLWKLRGSWTTSKTPAGVYDINTVFSLDNSAWGSLTSASVSSTIRGTDVHPETSSTIEIGTAVNVFQNRASLDVSYYSKRMFDFLDYADISPASGYTTKYLNTDEERTRKGVEITANVTPVKTNKLQWDVSFNWSTYATYYTRLDPDYTTNYGYSWVKVGKRSDAYVLNEYQKDPDGNIIHNNGLPLYSSYKTKFGNSDPDWIWGLNNTVRYNNWALNISIDGRVGGIAQTTTEMYMWRAGSHPNSLVPERYLDATLGTSNYVGDGVKVTSGSATYDTYGNITSDTRVYSQNDIAVTYKTYTNTLHKGTAWGGSPSTIDAYSTTFLKIREVSATYTFPDAFCEKIKFKGASVSAIGQNVFLWAKQFKYSDPDGGTENFSDPSVRYLGVSLKMAF